MVRRVAQSLGAACVIQSSGFGWLSPLIQATGRRMRGAIGWIIPFSP